LTIPVYAPPALPEVAGRTTVRPEAALDGVPPWRRDPVDRAFSRLRDNPRAVQLMLDGAGTGFTALTFAHTMLSAEFLFHGVFVLLALHAFLFGLRGTLIRIAIVSLPLLVYANAQAFGLAEQPLELTEWPLMFVIAVLVAWMADRRETTSRRYAALFSQASERLLTVQEDERRRIAGELHDGVGQVLTALTLTLDAASTAPRPELATRRIRLARRLADTALAETRDLAHRMRPARLEERGLVAALRDLANQSGFPVRVVAEAATADPHLLGPTATVEVFRIVQEALANAARHSGASQAQVSLAHRDNRLTIVISDEGRGFALAERREPGIGLAGMEERAEMLGGQLTIESQSGHGTRVTVSVSTVPAAVAG
jgi:signal transduction histidine kinase